MQIGRGRRYRVLAPQPGLTYPALYRRSLGLGPSDDSVDSKSFANDRHGLPLTTADGVRSVVHTLDLAGTDIPLVRTVVDGIIAWAKAGR